MKEVYRKEDMCNQVMRVCNKPGCNQLTTESYCELHLKERKQDNRKSAYRRGYNSAWRKTRVRFLINHPFCVECLKTGKHTAATVVDHIVPHKGNSKLFWDKNNWQPLCKQCHDRKTVINDGGFGRPIKR